MKKTIIFALCVCTLLCGCSKASDNSTAESKADSSSSQAASESDKSTDEKLNNLAKAIADWTGASVEDVLNGDFDASSINGEVHEVYDDTAVVEAYKNKDDSKLTDEKDKYIYTELCKAVDKLIKDDMGEYEKEKAVYDYIVTNTKFDDGSIAAIDTGEDNSHNPYGFFHDHTTICVGNATTFKLFMDVLGIDCKIIHSTEEGEHAWNVVKINDKWYHCDATFDGGDATPGYQEFNVPDVVKENDAYPWNKADFPECVSIDDCYAYKNAAEIKDVYGLPEVVKTAYDDNVSTQFVKMKLDDSADAEVVKAQITAIINNISMESDTSYIGAGNCMCFDGYALFGFTIYTEDDEPIDDDSSNVDVSDGLDIDYDKLSEIFKDKLDNFTFNGEASQYIDMSGDGNWLSCDGSTIVTEQAKG